MISEIHPSLRAQADESAIAIERSVKLALGTLLMLRLENNLINGITEMLIDSVAGVLEGLNTFVTLTAASMLTALGGDV